MRCTYIKPDGERCNANAMSGTNYCFTHNPDINDQEREQARTRGGQARALTLAKPLPLLAINEPEDAVRLVIDTISRVRAGELDIKTANCIGFLTDKLLKAFELSRLKDRIELVERVTLEKTTRY